MKSKTCLLLLAVSGLLTFTSCARPESGASSQNTDAIQKQIDNSANTVEKGPQDEQVYTYVEQMPSFPGGESALITFLNKNILYPSEARDNKEEGRVMLQFKVMKDGFIKDAKVLRGVSETIDKEALRVIVLMPRWQPGKQNGQPVNVNFTLPITFTLQ